MCGISYERMAIEDRNSTLYTIRKNIAECSHVEVKHVWVTLKSGSLIIEAEIEPNHQITRWPDTQALLLAINAQGAQAEHATMADRSQQFTPARTT